MAKWMPSASRPGIFKSRGQVAPVDKTTASLSARILWMSVSTPTCAFGTNTCKTGVLSLPLKHRVHEPYHALRGHEVYAALHDGLVKFHAGCGRFLNTKLLFDKIYTYLGIPYMRRPPIRSLRS